MLFFKLVLVPVQFYCVSMDTDPHLVPIRIRIQTKETGSETLLEDHTLETSLLK